MGNSNEARARRQSSAAELVAQGAPRAEIAQRGGFHRKTLSRWNEEADFQRQVERYRQADRQALELQGISQCQAQMAQLDQRRLQLISEVEERATSPEMDVVPGGRTGWLKRGVLVFEGRRFFVYRLDTRILKRFRELERHAAALLGQSPKWRDSWASLLKGTGWELDRAREQAALWTAQAELSQSEIAVGCRVDRRTLAEWKRRPEFQLRVAEHHWLWAAHCRSYLIARPETRVIEIRMRLQDLRQIQAEREAKPAKPYVHLQKGRMSVLGFRRIVVRSRSRLVAELTDDPQLRTEIEAHEAHLRDQLWS